MNRNYNFKMLNSPKYFYDEIKNDYESEIKNQANKIKAKNTISLYFFS